MRVLIAEINGIKMELPLTTTIDELKAMGRKIDIIEYKEVLENSRDDR